MENRVQALDGERVFRHEKGRRPSMGLYFKSAQLLDSGDAQLLRD